MSENKEKTEQHQTNEDVDSNRERPHGWKSKCDNNFCDILRLIAVFFSFCVVGGMVYSNGIIHAALLDRYNENVGLTSWAGALMTALMLLLGMNSIRPFLITKS